MRGAADRDRVVRHGFDGLARPRPANSDSKFARASATGSRWAFGRPDAATSSSSLRASGSSGTSGPPDGIGDFRIIEENQC